MNNLADESARLPNTSGDHQRVIANGENRGFVDACNQGAEAARGRHLVFLNNDTVVLPGWLDKLVATVERDARAGAVGSLFLYPDGRVQEAGAVVWSNGGTFHYGWGRSAEDRRFAFAREVDYCSGASLLIRRELFERLGGFDRRYAPAYYEDKDLAWSVLGRKVLPARFAPTTSRSATQARTHRLGDPSRQPRQVLEKWSEAARYHHAEDPAASSARPTEVGHKVAVSTTRPSPTRRGRARS